MKHYIESCCIHHLAKEETSRKKTRKNGANFVAYAYKIYPEKEKRDEREDEHGNAERENTLS